MKFNKLFILGLALTISFTGCKDDDSTPTQSLENAELSFSASDTPIELPQAMLNSTDPVAQQAVQYVESINAFTDQLALFDQIPDGATKSTTPIGRKNNSGGRSEDGYLVYTWSDGQTTVAYQISETTTTYIWEFFYQFSPEDEFVKVLKAEESKLIRNGYLEYYNFFSQTTTEEFIFRYQWHEDPDGTLYFDVITPDNSFTINAIISPDNSGSIKYYIDSNLYYDITWDAAGTGSWTLYNSDGSTSDSGTWS